MARTNRTKAIEAKTNIYGLREIAFAADTETLRLMTNPTSLDTRDIVVAIDGPRGANRGQLVLNAEQARALADWLPYILREPDREYVPGSDDLLDIHEEHGWKVAFEVGEVVEEGGFRRSVALAKD